MRTKFCFIFAMAAHLAMSLLCILSLADYAAESIVSLIIYRVNVFFMTCYTLFMIGFFAKYYTDYRFVKHKKFTKWNIIIYAISLLIYIIDPIGFSDIFVIGITYAISGFFMIYVVPSTIRDGYTFISIYRTLFVLSTLGATISVLVFFYSNTLGNLGMLASSIIALFSCAYYRNNYSK